MKIIKRYKETWILTQQDIETLKNEWIINWIGGKWCNLEWVLKAIKKLPYFDNKKYDSLYNKILYLSYIHDLDYYIGNNYLDFTIANWDFAYWVFKKLRWTTTIKRLLILILLFFWLQTKGFRYFKK